MIRSAYLATDRNIPKNRTKTIETVRVKIGGCCDAIVISHPLEMFSPDPPMYAKAPKRAAIHMRR
jgi:hypothetical protein